MKSLAARYGDTALGEEKSFNRTSVWIKPRVEAGGGSAAACSGFGKFIIISSGSPANYIEGGLITCGDKNFNVARYDIGTRSDGDYVAYITIPCEANMDDDSELILSGIKTSSLSAITSSEWTIGSVYPSNTNPDVASVGVGTFIFPVGSFSVVGGVLGAFQPTGCGSCHISQCAGTLSHTRG